MEGIDNKGLVLLDLFSGIGGFHKGLSDAGFVFDEVYFSEIDRHAIANYKYNYNEAKYIGSVEHILRSGIRKPNIITFGSPCQDFSLAGKRAGLGGAKSSLISHALAAVDLFRPEVFIWENVKGTFSSNGGRDFLAILQAIANIGGYECEWQLVNTAWILPQNRERIYLVGHLATHFRNWRNIFPIGENEEVVGKTQQEKGAANKIAYTITSCSEVKLNLETNYILSNGHGFVKDSVSDICPTIRSNSFEHNTAVIVAQRGRPSVLSPKRTEYGKSIRKNYENGSIKEKRKNIQQLEPRTDGITNTLTSVQKDNLLIEDSRIRRLTEIECERLQGFPDNWTKYGVYDKQIWINKKENTYKIVEGVQEIPKTQRYKMLGNAVTAKKVENISKRIKKNMDENKNIGFIFGRKG